MRRPGNWWRRKSTPAKVEAYTRWCYWFIAASEILAVGVAGFGKLSPGLAAGLFLAVAVHAAVGAAAVGPTLEWVLDRRPRPRRHLAAVAAATVLIAATALALAQHGPGEHSAAAGATLYTGILVFGIGLFGLGLGSTKRLVWLVAGGAVGGALLAVPLGMAPLGAPVLGLGILIGSGFLAFTSGFSVWLLKAVYALDEARETRARLAVAEERLRFGRDLHDVLGRNLAVIALKSELAVQLARRERPESVDQMIEVQRIAQESQREVREVVRGYRGVAVDTELAGAQGVLTAAGIDCAVTGAAASTRLPTTVQGALGWVVREAATNALRHGDATRCTIALTVTGGLATLTVENDGVPEPQPGGLPGALGGTGSTGGSGLAGLRERLAPVEGSLTAGPVGDGRFRVVAEVPVRGDSYAGGRGDVHEGSYADVRADGHEDSYAGVHGDVRGERQVPGAPGRHGEPEEREERREPREQPEQREQGDVQQSGREAGPGKAVRGGENGAAA
ncbi:sensor histidine kinase [Streptomyces physcomitrii]|uniref:Sensor histidine kinase n=1 Tax=Streptomyces physcomitrii TaxID=2724184 RepID=A0ABX1H0U8_9ACTN|nr:histidine kinase [Streptomyces physcomitrii]NKI40879.1 sensor histidine kinase [Streptomyces physcomitrii]